jgi:Zn-dependent protease with chaperone function
LGLSFALAALLLAATPPPETVALDGYAEWRHGEDLIVDGQRVRAAPEATITGAASVAAIPLGYEVRVTGTRAPDGSVRAASVAAAPNLETGLERQLRRAFDQKEAQFLREGRVAMKRGETVKDYGALVQAGPQVERARAVAAKVAPPYLDRARLRVYVVDNPHWNALCAPNQAVYVFRGLLEDADDDELAIALGHELAHTTHEHARRAFPRRLAAQLLAAAGTRSAAEKDADVRRRTGALLTLLAVSAWSSGFSREQEDQADRAGLRYAHEAGYDVRKGPGLWRRLAERYPPQSPLAEFFFAHHKPAADRARSLEEELALNYR